MSTISKIFFLSIFCLLTFQSAVIAQPELETGMNDEQTITNFTVEISDSRIDETTEYILNFKISLWEYIKLNKGAISITIPEGFNLSQLDSVLLVDDFKYNTYNISEITDVNNSLSLVVKRESKWDNEPDKSTADYFFPVNVQLILYQVKNPGIAGDYTLSIQSHDKNGNLNFGPIESSSFSISRDVDVVTTIIVSPGESLSLTAGTSQQFSAEAFDEDGEKIEDVTFAWDLYDCTECIGSMIDSTLNVVTTGEGRVRASIDSIFGLSGIVTVTPAELNRMDLQINNSQVVNNELIGSSGIILYDAFNNLKVDYNLFANPITLLSSQGEVEPNIFTNNSFQVGGVVRLSEFDIVYSGVSGLVHLTAEAQQITSNTEEVYFNNYDVIDVLDQSGQTISNVYIGQPSIITTLVQNNGNLSANEYVTVTAYFASQPANTVSEIFTPSPPGSIDEVEILLPEVNGTFSTDELIVETSSGFLINEDIYIAESQFSTEVTVTSSEIIRFVENSFIPDSILNRFPFKFSFALNTHEVVPDLDSSWLRLALIDPATENEIGVIFDGILDYSSSIDSIYQFTDIPALVDIPIDSINQYYPIAVEFLTYSSGQQLSLENEVNDSIYIISNDGISLVPNSLVPQKVYAGANVSFTFKVFLDSDQTYAYHESKSSFRLFDNQFSTTSNLFLETDSLRPGENIFHSSQISIQPQQIGQDLFAEALISFTIPGIIDTLAFMTDFPDGSLPIEVKQATSVQILDLEIIAPNSPKVNTSQNFQLSTKIINLSNSQIDSLTINLVSVEAASLIIDPVKLVFGILPLDTVEVLFDVTAAAVPNLLPESFRIDILSENVQEFEPVNNSAFLFIEEPAVVEYSYRINGIENANGIIVNQGDMINLSIASVNLGTAEVTDGIYQLVIEGLNSVKPDTLSDTISANSFYDYTFIAPFNDTVVDFTFLVIEVPIDKNSTLPAELINSEFTFSVSSITSDVELVFESTPIGSNLALPGRPKNLLELTITNTGSSTLNAIDLQQITFNFYNKYLNEIEARSVIGLDGTGFYDDGVKLTTSTYGGNNLTMWFDDFILEAQESKVITLQVEFTETTIETIEIEALQSEIIAVFADGPNTGNQVSISSTSGSEQIISLNVVIKGGSLEDSFIMDNNPFNPEVSPVHLSYELKNDANIEFRVFTLTGELVYSKHFSHGSEGGSIGENMIKWDGRNNSGEMVLNGIYIATIVNDLTGETARTKIALVK